MSFSIRGISFWAYATLVLSLAAAYQFYVIVDQAVTIQYGRDGSTSLRKDSYLLKKMLNSKMSNMTKTETLLFVRNIVGDVGIVKENNGVLEFGDGLAIVFENNKFQCFVESKNALQ